MGKNWDKLKGVETNNKQDIDRFKDDILSNGGDQNDNSKDIRKLEKKIKDLTKVVQASV